MNFFCRHAMVLLAFILHGVFFCNAQNEKQNQLSFIHTTRASGLGGAVACVPEGIESLLYNPAGLPVRLPEEDTIWTFMLNTDGFFQPKYLFPILRGSSGSENSAGNMLLNAKDLITTSGTGASVSAAIGYTGRKWGAGTFFSGSLFLDGAPFPLGTEGYVQLDMVVPLAYGTNVYKDDNLSLNFGLSVRPGIKIYKELDGSDVDALLGGSQTVGGIISSSVTHPYLGFPVDAGVILVAFDKPYSAAQIRFSAVAKNLFGDYYVPGKNIKPLEYPVSVQLGAAAVFPFQILGLDFYALLSLELHNANGMFSNDVSVWQSLCAGFEFSIERILRFQLGLASGYPCLGLELSLFAFSAGFSWQTVETGRYVGDNPLSVFRLSIAFHID